MAGFSWLTVKITFAWLRQWVFLVLPINFVSYLLTSWPWMMSVVYCWCRSLFIIDNKGRLRQITINDFPVGRSVDETLRLVQAFQFTDVHGEGLPVKSKLSQQINCLTFIVSRHVTLMTFRLAGLWMKLFSWFRLSSSLMCTEKVCQLNLNCLNKWI